MSNFYIMDYKLALHPEGPLLFEANVIDESSSGNFYVHIHGCTILCHERLKYEKYDQVNSYSESILSLQTYILCTTE